MRQLRVPHATGGLAGRGAVDVQIVMLSVSHAEGVQLPGELLRDASGEDGAGGVVFLLCDGTQVVNAGDDVAPVERDREHSRLVQ